MSMRLYILTLLITQGLNYWRFSFLQLFHICSVKNLIFTTRRNMEKCYFIDALLDDVWKTLCSTLDENRKFKILTTSLHMKLVEFRIFFKIWKSWIKIYPSQNLVATLNLRNIHKIYNKAEFEMHWKDTLAKKKIHFTDVKATVRLNFWRHW